ncbi:MAG: hypothetical protein ACLGJC_12965 [Alphaproteobacteria bacterium]
MAIKFPLIGRLGRAAVCIGAFVTALLVGWTPDMTSATTDGKTTYIVGLHYTARPSAIWPVECRGDAFDGTYSAWIMRSEIRRGMPEPMRHDLLVEWQWVNGRLDSVTVNPLSNQVSADQTSGGQRRFPDWATPLLRSWSTATRAPGQPDRSSEEAIFLYLCGMVEAKQERSFVHTELFAVDGLLSQISSPAAVRRLAEFVDTGRNAARTATTTGDMLEAARCSVAERMSTADGPFRSRHQFRILENIQNTIGRPLQSCAAGTVAEPTWQTALALIAAALLYSLARRAGSLQTYIERWHTAVRGAADTSRSHLPERPGEGTAVMMSGSGRPSLGRPAPRLLKGPSHAGAGGTLPAAEILEPLIAELESFAGSGGGRPRFAGGRACTDVDGFVDALVICFSEGLSGPLDPDRLGRLDAMFAQAFGDQLRLVLARSGDVFDMNRHHCIHFQRVDRGLVGRVVDILRPGVMRNGQVVHKASVTIAI